MAKRYCFTEQMFALIETAVVLSVHVKSVLGDINLVNGRTVMARFGKKER